MAEPIQPVPAAPANTDVLATSAAGATAPSKKRHPARTLVILAGVLVVLVVGFFVADGVAKSYAAGYVRDRIVTVLGVDPKTPVAVDLGGGSIILQAITGGLDQVTVDVQSLTFGDLSGSAHIVARDVPLDSSKPVGKLGIVMTISQDNVRALAGFLSGLNLKRIDVGDGVITIGTDLSVLFLTVPVSVALEPSAKDGGISFDPKTVTLGGNQVSVADLRANPQVRALVGDLLSSRDVCVASYLPEALAIDDVHVAGSDLVISIKGDGAVLGGPGLSTNGSCPPAG